MLPGTFEHALNHLLDCELDLSALDEGFCIDATGAPAYPPATLLELIRFAYSRGIVSSRDIERACGEQVTFIALCGDQAPHFTTLADFIREVQSEIANVFTQVLFICDAQGLIGREMFAIEGVTQAPARTGVKYLRLFRQAYPVQKKAPVIHGG